MGAKYGKLPHEILASTPEELDLDMGVYLYMSGEEALVEAYHESQRRLKDQK